MGAGWQRWWGDIRYQKECAEVERIRNDDPFVVSAVWLDMQAQYRFLRLLEEDMYRGTGKLPSKR